MDNGREVLLRKIQALSFAKVESELYLDIHPESKQALDYYKNLLDELDGYMTEYQNKYGPLFAEGVVGDRWTWTDNPWPWHHDANGRTGG